MTDAAAPPLRLVVMGTSPFALPALRTLVAGPHAVVAVYTQPPRPAGRGQELRPSPLHEAADALGLPVATPASLRPPEAVAELAALQPDLLVTAAYGLILPTAVLATPRLGGLNLHASLLPRWRGAAPIQRAILAGDAATGVAIFRLEAGLDTGPVYAVERLAIGAAETAGELHDRLADLAAAMLPGVVDGLAAGRLQPEPQPEDGVTYAAKIGRDEGRLDLRLPADDLRRRIRAYTPWPGAWCLLRQERLTILEAAPAGGDGPPGTLLELPLTVAVGGGALRIVRAQRAGRRPMAALDLARGLRLAPGEVLA